LKRSFADFSTAPFVARSLFGEVHATPDADLYYTLDYDGNFSVSRRFAAVAGADPILTALRTKLADFDATLSTEKAIDKLKEIWASSLDPENEQPDDEQSGDLVPEAVLLERTDERENRFRSLTPEPM
jgi:hypothetical protein